MKFRAFYVLAVFFLHASNVSANSFLSVFRGESFQKFEPTIPESHRGVSNKISDDDLNPIDVSGSYKNLIQPDSLSNLLTRFQKKYDQEYHEYLQKTEEERPLSLKECEDLIRSNLEKERHGDVIDSQKDNSKKTDSFVLAPSGYQFNGPGLWAAPTTAPAAIQCAYSDLVEMTNNWSIDTKTPITYRTGYQGELPDRTPIIVQRFQNNNKAGYDQDKSRGGYIGFLEDTEMGQYALVFRCTTSAKLDFIVTGPATQYAYSDLTDMTETWRAQVAIEYHSNFRAKLLDGTPIIVQKFSYLCKDEYDQQKSNGDYIGFFEDAKEGLYALVCLDTNPNRAGAVQPAQIDPATMIKEPPTQQSKVQVGKGSCCLQ